MLRITVEPGSEGSVVRMTGRLAGEVLEEAERVRLSVEPPVLIDARKLQGADADGIAFLAGILDGGGRVDGLSEYLSMRVASLREGRSG